MKRQLKSQNRGHFAVQTAPWLRSGILLSVLALASVLSTPQRLLAEDKASEIRALLTEDEEPEEIADEDVADEPDRFRRTSSRREVTDSEPTRSTQSASTSDGPGIIGQAGHLALKTFGRDQSISPIEAMPYILTDEHFIFSDLRGFVSNSALFGGNVGIGYRHLQEDLNAWYGASVWYDADGTSGEMFQQIGLSFEGLIDRWEFRSNVYMPVTSAQTYANSTGNERIVGNQLLYARYFDQGTPLQGVDIEAGYNLPVKEKHNLRAYVGYYHFGGGPSGGINGFKTRLEGVINNSVTAQVMYTTDPLYGSNVMIGCALQFPWGGSHPTGTWKQNTPSPFRFVERNYNVIIDRATSVTDNLVAFNPLTNAAYNIRQVSSNAAPGGDGTTANPYQTVAAAQAAGGDVILVQGNSVLSTAVTLTNGQQLLGDGSFQRLALSGGGTVGLPTQIAGGATPRISGIVGTAVTMATNSRLAGFTIANSTGHGVAGSNVGGATISDVTFQNIGGDAIRFTNSTGNFDLDNIVVSTTGGNGISFIGGAPNLSLSASITGTQTDGILLSNLTGGPIQINNTTIASTGGSGLRMNNVAADVTINSLSTSQTAGPAIALTGGTAANTYRFTDTTINQPGGVGFDVNNTNAVLAVNDLAVNSTAGSPAVSLTNSVGKITLSNLDVDTTNAVGLYGRNLTTLVVTDGSITTVNAGAVDVQNSTIDLNLNQVSVDTGPFGIRLINNTGNFNLVGNEAYASGGTIKNTTTGLILTSTGSTAINWLDLTNNGVGVQSSGNTQVTLNALRTTGSAGYAIDSMNDAMLIVRNSTFTNNGAIGGGTIRAQANTVATYQWLIDTNLITDHNGTPILLRTLAGGNGASLGTTVQRNTITADRAGSTMVDMNWNGPLSVSVANNTLNAGGANMTGIAVKNSSATDSVVARINNNALIFTGTNGTGILASATAGSTFQVDNNGVELKGIGGTGLRFNLGGVSNSSIFSNLIIDNAGSGTGMLFDTVAATSQLRIEANAISFLSTDLTTRRGIIFTSVTPTIQFSGSVSNVITNASVPFLIPVNSSTGSFNINGQQVP